MMEPNPPSPEEGSATSGARSQGHRTSAAHLRDTLSRAWDRGAEDARRTARDSIPRVREAASELAADLAYGLGFSTSFAATFFDYFGAKDASYANARGMTAGRTAAEELLRRLSRQKPDSPSPAAPEKGQPGVP